MYIPRVFCGYTCLLGLRGFIKRIFNVQLMCIHVCVYLERGRKRGREKETETKRERKTDREGDLMPKCVARSSKKPMSCWSASPNWRLALADPGFIERPKRPWVWGLPWGNPRLWGRGGGKHILSYSSFTWHNKYWFSVDLLTFCFVFFKCWS